MELRDNKKAIILLILLLMSVCIGISYAYWRLTLVQENSNEVASSCFKITFKEESNAINLSAAYPISDKEGRALTPYTFTITNECEDFAKYQINLEVLEDTTLSSEYIKVLLNEENDQVLTEKEVVEKTLENANTSYKLKTGYLDSKESVQTFAYMFYNMSSLTSINYGENFVYRNTADVTNMFGIVEDALKPTDPSWKGII